jgi:rhamnulose-1-phosphate aldolase
MGRIGIMMQNADMQNTASTNRTVEELISRSNRLGADKRNTNFAGGNTSAKGTGKDPVTGEDVQLLWVKGSGGDLGTLKAENLAVLRLDRLDALKNVYPGVEREDEMVAAFDYCLHGKGGAAPSIDTAMHGLVDAAHVDHLHPDSGIAIATAVDGEALTTKIFGNKVVWVPWRRPGFQLGLNIAAIKEANPQAIGTILGGHGITAWGDTSEEAESHSLWIIEQAEKYIADNGKAEPFGPALPGYAALPKAERKAKAAALAPVIRGLASTDKPQLGHFSDDAVVLDFLASAEHPRLGALGTSCPDHFLRTKVKPMPRSRTPSPACTNCTRTTARTIRPTMTATRTRTARHCAARIRPLSWSRVWACSPSARTSRQHGLPASSISMPSTSCAAPKPSPPTPRSRNPRSSGSNTGRWKKPSWPGCPSPNPTPPESHW